MICKVTLSIRKVQYEKRDKERGYPSQIKYRENNPSTTFRVKKEDKQRLDSIIAASGKPLSQWMTDFIHEKMDLNEETSKLANKCDNFREYALELETKNKELENEEKFIVPCSICGKPLTLSSKHSNWKTKIYPKLKEAFSTWGHGECKTRKPSPPTNRINSPENSKV